MSFNIMNDKWIKLAELTLRKSKSLANSFSIYVKYLAENSEVLIERGIVRSISIRVFNSILDKIVMKNINEAKFVVYGIDSSMSGLQRIGGFLVVPVSASSVKFEIRLTKEHDIVIDDFNYDIDSSIPEDIHDGLSPGIAYQKAQLAMLKMEVNLLRRILEKNDDYYCRKYIFIDGPIIDPPDIKVGEEDEFKQYMRERAITIKGLIDKNFLVIGFVKRIMGQQFYLHISGTYNINIPIKELQNDWTFASVILLRGLELLCKNECIIFTKPMSLVDRNSGFFTDVDLNIMYSYAIFYDGNEVKGPYRIDIPIIENINENEAFQEILYITSRLFAPGDKYPLPITLAHSLCTLPRREAYRILNSISSSVLQDLLIKEPGLIDYLRIFLQASGEM